MLHSCGKLPAIQEVKCKGAKIPSRYVSETSAFLYGHYFAFCNPEQQVTTSYIQHEPSACTSTNVIAKIRISSHTEVLHIISLHALTKGI